MLDQQSRRPLFKSPLPILQPGSVAIVGASERAKWPKQIFDQLKKFGFPGRVYPVNPKLTEIWGLPCYPDLASLPQPPDHALVIVPAPAVQSVLEVGVAAGLKSATVYSGYLGEGDDPEIKLRGEALKALIERSGLAVTGPNCMGTNSPRAKYFGYPAADLCTAPIGSVALVSQSGGTVRYIVKQGMDRGIRFDCAISSGNELDLDLADYVKHFVDDEHIRCIALFIEGVRRPHAFMIAAGRALEAGKPIVAIKTGKSQRSREASRSHTGAIAGDYEVFAAMCERYGIIHCPSLDDMTEMLLAFQAGRLPKGRRLGIVTTSGGTVDLLYDCLDEIDGVETPEFSAETQAHIRKLVAPQTAIKNPLDAGDPSTDAIAAEMCKAVLADPQVDILAWAVTLPSTAGARDVAAVRGVADFCDKPVIGFNRMNYMVSKPGLEFQEQVGFPFLQGLGPTLRGCAALSFYGERAGRKIEPLAPPRGTHEAVAPGNLNTTLAGYGLTFPRSEIAATPAAAADAARRIGFPVALKVVSPDISHKTDVGGVLLNLDTAIKVEAGAVALSNAVRKAAPEAALTGFLVQEMVSGVELIVGARSDPLYGPVMVVGAGGILVELVRDIALALLPVRRRDVAAMLDKLKVAKLLRGYRGRPACDMAALAQAICGLSEFFLDHRNTIADIEINPLVVLETGVCAVDVRVIPCNIP